MNYAAVSAGDAMPSIEGDTPTGRLRLDDFRGRNHVVLWSYPKDDTPG
jgi:peroxiredoxin